MTGKIGRRFGCAVAFEIVGAGDIDQPQRAERPGDQTGSAERPDAQRAVDTFLDKVHRPIGHTEIDVDAWITRQELRQRRRHDQPADAARQVDAQPPGRSTRSPAKQVLGLVHVRNQLEAAFIEGRAILRRRHLARRAVQEPCAEPRFERLHCRRNRGARQPQRIGRTGEARAFDDAGEDAEKLDPIQIRPYSLFANSDKSCHEQALYTSQPDDILFLRVLLRPSLPHWRRQDAHYLKHRVRDDRYPSSKPAGARGETWGRLAARPYAKTRRHERPTTGDDHGKP